MALDPNILMLDIKAKVAYSTRNACTTEIFNLLTDILADLVLEDIKQYPRIPTSRPIDSFPKQENTALPRQKGGE